MPIYQYKCSKCGHEEDLLQKMSDEPVVVCPSCKKKTFSKQITTNHSFNLKGSGWYKRGIS